LDPTITDIKLP